MIHIPIEQRYDKSRQMFHTGAWVAAGTIISVGASAAGTAMQASAANKAARATGAAGAKMDKRMREAQQRLVGQLGQIQAPQWNLARDIKEAGQVTDYNLAELQQIFPGAKTSREIAGQTAIAYQKGEIPKDVRDSIMRSVAELGGAGFAPQQAGMPQVGGFQAAQGLLSRQLGLTSLDLSKIGNQLSQSWQAIAGSFIESPLQVGQARLGYEKAAADIQLAKAQAEAGMAVDVAKGAYGTAVDTIGSKLAANQALARISSAGEALGSGFQAYGSAKGLQALAASQGAAGAYERSFAPLGEIATKEQYAKGIRGYGLAGSYQNLMAGQLGKPATAMMAPTGMMQSAAATKAFTGAYQ